MVWLAFCGVPRAGELSLDGAFTEGGLVIGRTQAGARVEFQGEPVRVSGDGIFLIGFGRDAPENTALEVFFRDGTSLTRTLAIEPRSYQITRIDGLPERKVTPKAEDLVRIRKETALIKHTRMRDDPRTDFLGGFKWPARGRISGVYGSQRILNGEPRRPHFGVDIAAPEGTPVVAPAAGVVTLVHADMFFSGATLIVDHGHGLSSAFLHLRRVLVKEGQRVRQGDPIAEVGATGRVTGPHLDWRINLLERRLDPALLTGPMPVD